jgi:hypothetical protein
MNNTGLTRQGCGGGPGFLAATGQVDTTHPIENKGIAALCTVSSSMFAKS